MSPRSIGRLAANHPWLTLLAWFIVLAASIFMATKMNLSNDDDSLNATESSIADDLLNERFRTTTVQRAPDPDTIVNDQLPWWETAFVIIAGSPEDLSGFLPEADAAFRDPTAAIFVAIQPTERQARVHLR